jgi:hypothetical protein
VLDKIYELIKPIDEKLEQTKSAAAQKKTDKEKAKKEKAIKEATSDEPKKKKKKAIDPKMMNPGMQRLPIDIVLNGLPTSDYNNQVNE